MSKNISKIIKQLILPIVCVSFVISFCSVTWADDSDTPPTDDGGQPGITLLKKTVTINKKSSSMVATGAGERYGVNQSTMVVGQDGNQIMLQYLLIPCEAQLIYETTSDGGKMVHRIQVIDTHATATNRMSEKPK